MPTLTWKVVTEIRSATLKILERRKSRLCYKSNCRWHFTLNKLWSTTKELGAIDSSGASSSTCIVGYRVMRFGSTCVVLKNCLWHDNSNIPWSHLKDFVFLYFYFCNVYKCDLNLFWLCRTFHGIYFAKSFFRSFSKSFALRLGFISKVLLYCIACLNTKIVLI